MPPRDARVSYKADDGAYPSTTAMMNSFTMFRSGLPQIALVAGVLSWGTACAGGGTSGPADPPRTTRQQATGTPSPTLSADAKPHVPTIALPPVAPISATDEDGEWIDPIESLQALLDAGEVDFEYDPVTGYLPALLAALDIPVSSQTLIFSRTSLQTEKIAPWAPRGVYFNDDVYIGYVSDDSPMLEIASIDPDDGGIFYVLPQDPSAPPNFLHETRLCLGCHEANPTMNVPGVLVRSTLTDRMGRPIQTLQSEQVTDQTPWHERFAGWYVTGTHGGPSHGGNVRAELESFEVDNAQQFLRDFDLSGGGNMTDLTGQFDVSVYLSEHSDLVALLVLTHQTRVHNVITHVHRTVEDALRDQTAARITLGVEIPESGLTPTTEIRIESAVDQMVREMFFSGAVPIPGPVRGTSTYAEEFEARGPFDSEGRTLREFELDTRLFRYPLSFLVYTDAFDALPDLAKDRAFRRFEEVLSGADTSEDFAHLDAATRTAIREILLATKPDFAAFVN